MKLYTEQQVKELLDTQKGNCYVAVLNETKDTEIASLATKAPLPGGDDFDKYYGIDPESLLKEDLADKELQENYERFKKDLAYAKEKYNELVPILNERIQLIETLKELIVGLATQGMSTLNAGNDLKIAVDELKGYKEAADGFMKQINENKKLIKDYEDWSERKLFMHWDYLTFLKATDKPWMEWKKQYKDIVI